MKRNDEVDELKMVSMELIAFKSAIVSIRNGFEVRKKSLGLGSGF